MLLHSEPSPPAPSARRCLRLFSILLASRCCGCESRTGTEGRSSREAWLYRWGGGEWLFCFFLLIEADRLSQPAGRRTQARGAGRGPERTGQDALLSVLYGVLTSRSGATKMAATGSVWVCPWNEEHWGVHKLQIRTRQKSRATPVLWRGGWGNHKASAGRCLPVGSWWRHWFLQCVASLSGNWRALQPCRLFTQESWKGIP